MEYVAFADESYVNAARFRSICAISMPREHLAGLEETVRKLLAESSVAEFKWQKLKNAKYRFCAKKLYSLVLDQLHRSGVRVDVLIWDTQDSRHQLPGRDDTANFERMYFHLLGFVMKRRVRGANWHIFPDEKLGIDWKTVAECLAHVGQREEITDNPLLKQLFVSEYYAVKTFRQVKSEEAPFCQLADFFAGIAAFSRIQYCDFALWQEEQLGVLDLFSQSKAESSRGEAEKFDVLAAFNQACKDRKLGVSLREKKALWTPDFRNPVNFWHYTPQHEMDKAPTRAQRREGPEGVEA